MSRSLLTGALVGVLISLLLCLFSFWSAAFVTYGAKASEAVTFGLGIMRGCVHAHGGVAGFNLDYQACTFGNLDDCNFNIDTTFYGFKKTFSLEFPENCSDLKAARSCLVISVIVAVGCAIFILFHCLCNAQNCTGKFSDIIAVMLCVAVLILNCVGFATSVTFTQGNHLEGFDLSFYSYLGALIGSLVACFFTAVVAFKSRSRFQYQKLY